MHLENTFAIPANIDVAWEVFNDPTRFAPCVPGAALESSEGDSFAGTMRVRLGTFALNYQGTGTYLRRDHAGYRVLIDATGRDARGDGTATAKVTGSFAADGPDRTRVTMITELTVTGRPAQFGRAMIAGVGDEMVSRFASCLSRKLAPDDADAVTSGAGTSGTVASAGTPGTVASGAGTSGTGVGPAAARGPVPSAGALTAPTDRGAVGAPDGTVAPAAAGSTNGSGPGPVGVSLRSTRDTDVIDLLEAPGSPMVKRALPALLALLLLFVVIRRIKSR